MRITCPECEYTREVPDDKIPSTSVRATCPKCGAKFRFRAEEPDFTLEPQEPPASPEAPSSTAEPEPHADLDSRAEPDSGTEAQEPPAPEEQADNAHARPGHPASGEDRADRPRPKRIVLEDEPSDEDIWQRLENLGAGGGESQEQQRSRFGAEDYPEDEAPPEAEVPWERLDQFGFFGGLVQTIKRAMLAPGLFFAAMPLGRGLTMPLIFFLLVSQFQVICQLFWHFMGIGSMMDMGGEAPMAEPGAPGVGPAGSLMLFLVYPVLFTIWLFVAGGILHVLLKLFGSGRAGFEGTFRAMAYSAAPSVLAILPYVGSFAAGFWSLVIMFIGLKVIHASSFIRVLFAFLLPLVVIAALAASIVTMQPGLTPNMY